ncbi:MAG: hypothetical protein K2V38_10260 [Gemmataceae bacterium]|nr:hypothetical protein [Gemmataceae bacterium]
MTNSAEENEALGCGCLVLLVLKSAAIGSAVGGYAFWTLMRQAHGLEAGVVGMGVASSVFGVIVYGSSIGSARASRLTVWLYRLVSVSSALSAFACWLILRQSQGWVAWAWGVGIGVNIAGWAISNLLEEGTTVELVQRAKRRARRKRAQGQ